MGYIIAILIVAGFIWYWEWCDRRAAECRRQRREFLKEYDEEEG